MANYIDPITAKKFARCGLAVAAMEQVEAIKATDKLGVRPAKINKRIARAVEHLEAKCEPTRILSSLVKRMFIILALEPIVGEKERPNYGALQLLSCNFRSNNQYHLSLCVVTTHAIERLIMRTRTPNVMEAMRREITWDTVVDILLVQPGDEGVKVKTAGGWAVIMVTDNVPYMVTWYTRDEEQPDQTA